MADSHFLVAFRRQRHKVWCSADWKYLATAAVGTDSLWFTRNHIQFVTCTKRQRGMPSRNDNLHGLSQSLALGEASDYV
jgi:hypothetical protein